MKLKSVQENTGIGETASLLTSATEAQPELLGFPDVRPSREQIKGASKTSTAELRAGLLAKQQLNAELVAGHQASIDDLNFELIQLNGRLLKRSSEITALIDRRETLAHELGRDGDFRPSSQGERFLLLRVADEKQQIVHGLGAALSKLEAEEESIGAPSNQPQVALTAQPTLQALESAVAKDEALISNLESQLQLIDEAKQQLADREHALGLIEAQARADIEQLGAAVESGRRALLCALIDLASSAPSPEKQQLLEAFDLSEGRPALAAKLLRALVEQGWVSAANAPGLANDFFAFLTAQP